MKKIDFYGTIHKVVRRRLFLVSMQIGSTDFADERALADLDRELQSLFQFLKRHAEHENTHVNPLIKRVAPEVDFDTEHAAQEAALDSLEHAFQGIVYSDEKRQKGAQFYWLFNAFVASFLEHLNEEEQAMDLLWQHYTHVELAATFQAIVTSITPAEMQDTLPFMLVAINPQEREAFAS